MKSRFDLAIFDLDGTLLDSVMSLTQTFNQLRQRQNIPPVSSEEVRPFVSSGAHAIISNFHKECSQDEIKEMQIQFYEIYEAVMLNDNSVLFANIFSLLQSVKDRGIKLAIATNKLAKFTHPILERLHINEMMDAIVCRDDVAKAKPHPEMVDSIIVSTEVNPNRALILGDDLNDILAGNASGITTVIAGYGYGDRKKYPHWQADHTIDEPLQLLELL